MYHTYHMGYCVLTLPGDDVREEFTEEGGIWDLSGSYGRVGQWCSEGRRGGKGSF